MHCLLASIFYQFWWILEAKLGSKIDQKSIQKGIENMMQNKSRFERVLERFWVDFGPIWAPKIISGAHYAPSIFALKISFMLDTVFLSILDRFWMDFGSIFG